MLQRHEHLVAGGKRICVVPARRGERPGDSLYQRVSATIAAAQVGQHAACDAEQPGQRRHEISKVRAIASSAIARSARESRYAATRSKFSP